MCLSLGLRASAAVLSVTTPDWTGSGETNGWVYTDLGKPYSENSQPVAIHFSKGGAAIRSPVVDGDLVSVEVVCRSSPTPVRMLSIRFLSRGEAVAGPFLFDPVPSGTATRRFTVARSLAADSFEIALGAGASGDWGIYSIAVECCREDEVRAPYALANRAKSGSHRFLPAWKLPEEAVAAELRLITESPVAFTAEYGLFHGFEEVTNTTKTTKDVTRQICESHSDFDGVKICAPPSSVGRVMIGTRDLAGMLAIEVPSGEAASNLVFTAARFVSDDEGREMPVDGVYTGSVTNRLETVRLLDEARTFAIPLAEREGIEKVILGSTVDRSTPSRANGRVLLDSVGFASSFVPEHIETNELRRLVIHGNAASLDGFSPGSSFKWSVRALDSSGHASPFAEYHSFTAPTTPPPGTVYHLQ